MADLLKFIQARLANPVNAEAEEASHQPEPTPTLRDDAPQIIRHPHITSMQQWLDLNA